MVGEKMSYENRGIIPRAIGHIFRAISDRPDLAFRVAVSYLEVRQTIDRCGISGPN